MLRNPAGERNKQPILEVLQMYIDVNKENKLLEISSGPGLHVSFIAKHFPKTVFQPTEFDVGMFNSIREYSRQCENVYDPLFVDISADLENWEGKFESVPLKDCLNTFDFILNINMMHISPFICSIGLFKNSSKLLKPNGLLFTYGPYSINNVLTPESNVNFNESLKRSNPTWGIRDLKDLSQLAESNSMELIKLYDLPANNKLLVWRKN